MGPDLPPLSGALEWGAETDEMRIPKYTVCDVWTGRPMRSGRWDIMLSCAYMRGRRVVCRGRSMHTEVLESVYAPFSANPAMIRRERVQICARGGGRRCALSGAGGYPVDAGCWILDRGELYIRRVIFMGE